MQVVHTCVGYSLHSIQNRNYSLLEILRLRNAVCNNSSEFQFKLQNHLAMLSQSYTGYATFRFTEMGTAVPTTITPALRQKSSSGRQEKVN